MESKSRKEFERTIVLINTVLSVNGNNILSEDGSSGTRKKLLRVLSIFVALSLPITCATAVLCHLHDFMKLSEALCSSAICTHIIFKFFMVRMLNINLRDIIERCRKFRIKFAEDIEIERSVTTDTFLIRKAEFVTKIMYFSYTAALIAATLTPLLIEERVFPFFYYLPFCSPFESPCYELNYAYIIVAIVWFALHAVLGTDSLFTLIISEMCLQCNVIKLKLSKFGKFEESEYENQVKLLREIQEMTQELSESITKIDATFSIVFLVTFLTAFVILSVLLFLITTDGRASDIGLIICVILQLLFYCLFGELLKHKMESLTFLLYDTEWYNLKIKEQKSLITIMTCSQIVPTLRAGGYAELSLDTYMQILKTVYTYYAIMRDHQT